jgi:hypothetical protein
MATPFTFITTHSINEGRLAEYWAQNAAFAEFVAANEPDLLEFGTFMNDDQTEVTFVFGFPDAAAADRHMQVAREKIGQGLEITRTARLEVLGGSPGPVLGQVIAANAEAGVPVAIKPAAVAGFTRRIAA